MSFGQAVRTVLQKYADFKGRASRSEFWWWLLFYYIGAILFLILIPRLSFLWNIAFLIPNLAVGVRRMHDSDHSGWWVICPFVNLVFSFFPSTPGPNRFDTVGGTYAPTVTEAQLSSTSSACPTCGKLRLPGQNFCQGCGAKFE
jgi:hypothetical protein